MDCLWYSSSHLSDNRQGAGPRGVVGTLSQYMLSSAATLGFFLAIGSVGLSLLLFSFLFREFRSHDVCLQVIRSDSGQIEYHPSLFQNSGKLGLAPPILNNPAWRATRGEALQRMKMRWEEEKQREAAEGRR
jgi:hypothetical protein